MTPLHTSIVTAKGGREGYVKAAKGVIDMPLTMPTSLGGKGEGQGTNPEELFAAGYAACFESALRLVARERDIELPETTAVTCEVTICKDDADSFVLSAGLRANLAGIPAETADELVRAAHEACPYSKATRGNMQVDVSAET